MSSKKNEKMSNRNIEESFSENESEEKVGSRDITDVGIVESSGQLSQTKGTVPLKLRKMR